MAIIAFIEDRAAQAAYLISLADTLDVPRSEIEVNRDGWDVPQAVADDYDVDAIAGYNPTPASGGSVKVVNAGTNLAAPRAEAAVNIWKFDAGVDTGVDNANVVNGLTGDFVFVASA